MAAWYCYLLVTADNSGGPTYVGVTPDLDRRLRQHNGELTGGAKATSGKAWRRACHVTGFPNQRAVLQFEWAWKQRTKRYKGGGRTPLQRRLLALQELLSDSRPTSRADSYETYSTPLDVVLEEWVEVPTL